MKTNEKNKLAKDLIPGYLNDELTRPEIEILKAWIMENSENKHYFNECVEIWLTNKALSENTRYNYRKAFTHFIQNIDYKGEGFAQPVQRKFPGAFYRYAAVFLIAFMLGGGLFYFTRTKNPDLPAKHMNELVVPLGSHAQYTLSDGTLIVLNAGSTLKFDDYYGVRNRTVRLEGEGYFKVARNPDKPFVVITPYLNVRAIGTAFNVKAYAEDKTIETTLIEGSVSIEGIKSPGDSSKKILRPNQKLTYYKESNTTDEASVGQSNESGPAGDLIPAKGLKHPKRIITENIDVNPIVSWKENKWIFKKENLAEIATKLERKYDVKINFDSERVKTFRFTGTVMAEPIEQVLEVISLSAPINYRLEGRIVTLSEDKNEEDLNKKLYRQ